MHFVDRVNFIGAPTATLQKYCIDETPKWLAYKNYQLTKIPPLVAIPASKWNDDVVRTPLANMFHLNCCYCGNYSDLNSDAEVDHFFPKKLDTKAEYIYSWENYVWACHPCNNKKRNHYPVLNPCDKNEMSEIYFHAADGRYECYLKADKLIQDKFTLTENQTFINSKISPQKRRNIYKQLTNIYLKNLLLWEEIYEVENKIDSTSDDTISAKKNRDDAILELKEYLESKEFVLLKHFIFDLFKKNNPTFNYQYQDFI